MRKKELKYVLLDKKADFARLLLSCVFIALVFIPLFTMFSHIDGESLQKVIHAPNFGTVVANSLISTAISTVITLPVCVSVPAYSRPNFCA